MKNHLISSACVFVLLLLLVSCQRESVEEQEKQPPEEITALPLNPVDLSNLNAFRPAGENWSITGGVQSDYQVEHDMKPLEGTGVLTNIPDDTHEDNLFTEMEHGDMELKLEFMVPKGSNSGVYFQGRYEVQILDSRGVEDPDFYDVGGIYERWDETRPEGERGYEGHPPRTNAGKAPGLWQELHVMFRAPRFDENGNKIENARFEWVDLNGTRIHEDVEVTGPTRAAAFDDEAAKAPLMLQGDHGPVAFRNIKYKTYGSERALKLSELNYTVYDYHGERVPGFDTLSVIEEGVTDSIDVVELSPKDEHYAMRFTGELEVPVSGEYLFQTQLDNGGNLYIDGELVVEKTGEFDHWRVGNIIHLDEGTYDFELSYFQAVWGRSALVFYEGPGMEKTTLASPEPEDEHVVGEPLVVEAGQERAEILGGFFNYRNEKRTHVLAVGDPQGVHYSYDLNRGALLSYWRGGFADASGMWEGRGSEQLMAPLNAAAESSAGIPVVQMNADNAMDNQRMPEHIMVEGYTLNEAGRPTFEISYPMVTVYDYSRPVFSETGKLERTLRFRPDDEVSDLAARIAQGQLIELLDNGLYRIDGKYYIELGETSGTEPVIEERNGQQALFVPVSGDEAEIRYRYIW